MKNPSKTKEILIIKNIAREDAGILGDIIREHGIGYKVIDLSKGDKISSAEKYAAVIVLGGPDSANDQNLKMQSELAFIRKVITAGIPYLGICLGLQTMVKAAGGQVVRSPVREIGFRDHNGQFYNIVLTREGRKDPLFDGMDDTFNVFHLHGETVNLTYKMKLLGEGKYCRNQIVKTGPRAYGIQCHFELTPGLLKNWTTEDPDLKKLDIEQLNADYHSIKTKYTETGRQIFQNFLRISGLM